MTLASQARTAAGLPPAVRRQVAGIVPDQPLFNLKTMEEVLAGAARCQQVSATLFSLFGAVAFCLAGIGLYAVVSLLVSRQTRDLGVRMALGAGRGQVLRLVLLAGAWQVGAGILLGFGLAAALGRLLAAFLYHAKSWAPGIFAAVALGLASAGLLACAAPALRAARIEPAAALRRE